MGLNYKLKIALNLNKIMKKKLAYDDSFTLAFLIILLITFCYNSIFQGGSRVPRIFLIFITIVVAKLFFKVTFLKKSRFIYMATLIFIFISMYLGNVLNFYTYIDNYDKILHFISGIIIGFIGVIIFAYFTQEYFKKINPMFVVFFSVIFAIALAGTWEIWEFTTDRLFGLNSQLNSLIDTMTDIICGTVGGLISAIPIYLFAKGKHNKFLSTIIKEIID